MNDKPRYNYQKEIDNLRSRFGLDFVSVALVQPAEDRFVLTWQFVSGNINNRYKRIALQSGKGIAGVVFKTGKPLLMKNVNMDIGAKDLFNYPIIVAERLQSLGALPLWSYNRVMGVLLFGFRQENALTEALFHLIQEEIGPEFGSLYAKERVIE
ncbi:GAF domain-containing protein [Paenibacillus wynnii]|uniref:GAF domain-containing protein n=1 Tax=Paenibacillus wynnii TaxID=268407 RepID=UPI00279158A8|nr:GAF domain-containing protein [Paenibacillus wynnii]MDQ0194781.1 nitrogen regulatory protein A [Paenibacillus wynnii]